MPLRNVRYRVGTTRNGTKVRLAFDKRTGKVKEIKRLKKGKK